MIFLLRALPSYTNHEHCTVPVFLALIQSPALREGGDGRPVRRSVGRLWPGAQPAKGLRTRSVSSPLLLPFARLSIVAATRTQFRLGATTPHTIFCLCSWLIRLWLGFVCEPMLFWDGMGTALLHPGDLAS